MLTYGSANMKSKPTITTTEHVDFEDVELSHLLTSSIVKVIHEASKKHDKLRCDVIYNAMIRAFAIMIAVDVWEKDDESFIKVMAETLTLQVKEARKKVKEDGD